MVSGTPSVTPVILSLLFKSTNCIDGTFVVLKRDTSAPLSTMNVHLKFDICTNNVTKLAAFKFTVKTVEGLLVPALFGLKKSYFAAVVSSIVGEVLID